MISTKRNIASRSDETRVSQTNRIFVNKNVLRDDAPKRNYHKSVKAEAEDDDNESSSLETPKKEKVKANSFFINFLGGNLLSKEGVVKQFPFLLYLVLLAMLYITNTYIAEDMTREILRTNRILEDRHVEYIYLKSEITDLTKQSVLAKRLKGKGIKESVESLKKIKVDKGGCSND